MIKRPTVLVLGAGSSAPYGFPTGRGLLLEACSALRSGNQTLLHLLSQVGIHANRPGDFALLLEQSMQPSIDSFVENRPGHLDVGKAAIAVSLIPHEKQQRIEDRGPDLLWYEYLFHHLGPSVQDIEKSDLTIITFNYDRSLEYFLYNTLVRAFGLDPTRTHELYSRIPIIHVHGDLGVPHFISHDGREYSPTVDLDSLRIAMNRILIPGAEDIDDTPFSDARKAIGRAEILCFLGFAFHPPNVRRLAITPNRLRKTYACAYRLPKAVVSEAREIIPDAVDFGGDHEDALVFLQSNPILG